MASVINADGAVLGRLASQVAKLLLKGDEVAVVNAEKAVITGNPKFIKEKYFSKFAIGSPQHGPYFPRRSDMIVRRTISGMLPNHKFKGRDALKRLRVYSGMPEGIEGEIKPMKRDIHSRFMTIGELANLMNSV